MNHYHKKINSPLGNLTLIASDQHLLAILWENDDPNRIKIDPGAEANQHSLLLKIENQLVEYFEKKRRHFEVDLYFTGTEFQKKVWAALLEIPFGETRSYNWIAKHIGSPGGMRAVGLAANKNPISIVAPCHRVIGASGQLTGFAGGLANKSYLLHLENKNLTLFED